MSWKQTFTLQLSKVIATCAAVLFCWISSGQKDGSRFLSDVFEEVDIQKDVTFGNSTSQGGVNADLNLDFYAPKNDDLEHRPLIILAHGGFFLFGDKSDFEAECMALAKRGYATVSIDYRLIDIEGDSVKTPKYAAIDAIADMKAAVRFFYKDASGKNQFKIDTNNIFIGGYSAGAITSLHYAYATEPNDILLMGGNDLFNYVAKNGGKEGRSGNPGYSTKIKGVINIAGSLYSAKLVDAGEPPLFSIHGNEDDTVPYTTGKAGDTNVSTEGSGLIHQQADKVKIKNQLVTLEGEDHLGFFYCEDCLDQLCKFIASCID